LDKAISSVPRMRAWMFSSVVSSARPHELRRQRGLESLELGQDGNLVVAHAQARRHVAGVDPADVRGVGRGHHHRAHPVAPDCIHRHRQHQRGVDAARQAQQHAGKAVLANVVTHAQHQGVPEVGIQRPLRHHVCYHIDSIH
jgi:hypothetical protein